MTPRAAAKRKAPAEFDFTQRDPIEGKEPTERTEVRAVYDDAAIYFDSYAGSPEYRQIQANNLYDGVNKRNRFIFFPENRG